MFNFSKKNKEYTVIINSRNGKQEVEVLAEDRKDALEMAKHVILNCDLFNIKPTDEFSLSFKSKFFRK